MDSNITIRSAEENDKNGVLDLLNTVFFENQRFDWNRDGKYWQWKYKDNVFGKTVIKVAKFQDSIVGASAMWPWKLIYWGEVLDAYEPCDTAIHPDYQGRGIFYLFLDSRNTHARRNKTSLLFNFPNNNSLHGNLKRGWHYLGHIEWLVKPLKPFHLVANFRNSGKSRPQPIDTDNEIKISVCDEITKKYSMYDGILKTYKPKGFYKWRYKNHPYFNYGMIVVEKRKDSAGAIFMVTMKNKIRELVVVDVFGSKLLMSSLFAEITRLAKKYDVDYIITTNNTYSGMNGFWKKGFIKVKNKNMVVFPLDRSLEDKVLKYSNWSIVGGMHDSL